MAAPATPSVERPRVGGQALADGVLMRTSRAWAVARVDGSVEVGPFPKAHLTKLPVIRVLAGLGPALAMGVRALANGAKRGGKRTNRGARQLLILLIALSVLGFVAPHLPGSSPTGVSAALAGLATMVVTLAVLRSFAPKTIWRYHGAEHKAVTAHEAGFDPADVAAALAQPRVHPRCGTNLVAMIGVASIALGRLPGLVQVPAFLLALGVAAELLSLAGRRPRSIGGRLLLGPGAFLQQYVTTAEPSHAEQAVACAALHACLAEHERLTTAEETEVALAA